MRGRKPDELIVKRRDMGEIEALLAHGDTPLRVARRARILLSCARTDRVEQVADVADKVAQDRVTVWRVCERYRSGGVMAALYDAPRSGRPRVFFSDHAAQD
jgi:hypothetical protein